MTWAGVVFVDDLGDAAGVAFDVHTRRRCHGCGVWAVVIDLGSRLSQLLIYWWISTYYILLSIIDGAQTIDHLDMESGMTSQHFDIAV